MTRYRLNDAAVRKARALIGSGDVDTTTSWSDAAPDAARENDHIERHGYDGYGEWHLGIDPDASRTPRAASGSRSATSGR
jgi:hypothetical protein